MDTAPEQGPINIQEEMEVPINLKLRLETCPKCDYIRQPDIDKTFSPYECPACGVVYALALEEVRQEQERLARKQADESALKRAESEFLKRTQTGSAMFAKKHQSQVWGAILAAAALLCGLYFLL